MTALNVRVTETAVHLLTDGAAYDTKGRVTRTVNKAQLASDMGAVVAASGFTGVNDALVEYLRQQHVDNFDACWYALPDAAHALFKDMKKRMPEAAKISTTFIVAGWSMEREGPEAFIISNFDDDRQGTVRPAFEVKAVRGFECPNISGRIQLVTDDNVEHEGLRLLEEQRRRRSIPVDSRFEVVHGVGGFAQLTTVTKDQMTVKVLKYWPDVVGQPIRPTTGTDQSSSPHLEEAARCLR